MSTSRGGGVLILSSWLSVGLLGCGDEGQASGEEDLASLQQAAVAASACEGVTAQPPAAGRYRVLRVKAEADTTLREMDPNSNQGSSRRCYAFTDPRNPEKTFLGVCLMRFSLDLPATAQVHYAQLALQLEAPVPAKYFIHSMDVPWSEQEATWNVAAAGTPWTRPGAADDRRAAFCTFNSAPGRVSYNLGGYAISQIQDWVSGRAPNFGLGFFTDYQSAGFPLSMASSEGDPAEAPELVVWYTDEPVPAQSKTLPAVASTTIDKASPTRNFAARPACEVGRVDSQGPEKACALRWDLSTIPPGSLVTRVAFDFGAPPSMLHRWDLFPLRRAWVEKEVTWNAFSAANEWQVPGAYGAADVSATAGYILPSTTGRSLEPQSAGFALVQRWVDDPSTNKGALFATSRLPRRSTPNWLLTAAPALIIRYTPPS